MVFILHVIFIDTIIINCDQFILCIQCIIIIHMNTISVNYNKKKKNKYTKLEKNLYKKHITIIRLKTTS